MSFHRFSGRKIIFGSERSQNNGKLFTTFGGNEKWKLILQKSGKLSLDHNYCLFIIVEAEQSSGEVLMKYLFLFEFFDMLFTLDIKKLTSFPNWKCWNPFSIFKLTAFQFPVDIRFLQLNFNITCTSSRALFDPSNWISVYLRKNPFRLQCNLSFSALTSCLSSLANAQKQNPYRSVTSKRPRWRGELKDFSVSDMYMVECLHRKTHNGGKFIIEISLLFFMYVFDLWKLCFMYFNAMK